MDDLIKELEKISDKEYAIFQAKLTPTIAADKFIGVRVPVLRSFAKEYAKTSDAKEFIAHLPHKYYDENMLHSLLLSQIKDYDECIKEIDRFSKYMDNWAVCDICSPKILKKRLDETICHIKRWICAKDTYTIRFAIEMLMSFYLDDNFKAEFLDIPLRVIDNDEYYVKMMIAWFYSTSLAKQYDSTIHIIENKMLPNWVHNKTIQKAIESNRITDEKKDYLRSLKK